MLDPFVFSYKMQAATIAGAMYLSWLGMANASRLFRDQARLLQHTWRPRRHEDAHVHQEALAKGPELLDHYGRRSHDVDIEHMR